MPITALPAAPNRTRPATFSADADALLGALPTMVAEFNASMAGESAAALALTLSGTAPGDGTARIGSNDAGDYFLGATSETQLQELGFLAGNIAGKGTTADLAAALTAWVAAYPSGSRLSLGKATWTMPASGYTYAGSRLHFTGEGKNVSLIAFNPGATATALTFNNGGGSGTFENSVRHLGFTSSDSFDKTAIYMNNVANSEIENVAIASGSWLGDSIGVKVGGRQLLHIKNAKLACARPLVFVQNPETGLGTLSTDHFLVENCELIGTSATRSVIEFASGVSFSNCTIRNTAIVGGQHGIVWSDTTSPAASFALAIQNIRTEQATDTTGWSIKLDSTAQILQDVLIDNAHLDSTRNGIRIRNAQRVTLRNVVFAGGAGKTSLDITMVAGGRLLLENCFGQASSTITITNGRCIRRVKDSNTIGCIEEWIFDDGTALGRTVQHQTIMQGIPVTVAQTAQSVICTDQFSGFIMVTNSSRVSAIYACTGSTHTTLEVSDPNAAYTIAAATANQNNIFYNGANLVIENLSAGGGSQDYSISLIGRAV